MAQTTKVWTKPALEVMLIRSAQAIVQGNNSDGVLGRLLHRS